MPHDERHKSRTLTEGPDRAPARAMLKAIGFSTEELARPLIAVAHTWTETMPCNFHLRGLAQRVKEGIREAGATPMEFNTISVSDGVVMGTEGMKGSLVSRELVADSIELVCRSHLFDAVVALVGCEKTIPGGARARRAAPPARRWSSSCARTAGRSTSSAAHRSRMPSRASPPPVDRRTRSCTCSRWPAKRECR